MNAKALMVVGTTSHAGKSLVATGFCRLFREMGYSVAPFKAQNMSNNSFVTAEGGEMGRAQVGQAEAAGVEPHVDMNPVLLKPTSDQGSQVVVHGRPIGTMKARDYYAEKPRIWEAVCESYHRLASQFDIIVLEGAGSPAEVNLRDKDIVNMRMALEAGAPTLLVADIERGGVFASAVGTYALLTEEERALMCGTLVNKFRGDVTLFGDGGRILEERTGAPFLGILPFVPDLAIDEEDGLSMEKMGRAAGETVETVVAVPALPRISNLTDMAPLWALPGVEVRSVTRPEQLEDVDCVILPGTKSTWQDLQWLKERGLAVAIQRCHRERGVPVIGICGGYQMLGTALEDPTGEEGEGGRIEALGLLPQATAFRPAAEKITCRVEAEASSAHPFLPAGERIEGYEIHSGMTAAQAENAPQRVVVRQASNCHESEGACCRDSSYVLGTYIHGYFDRHAVTAALINDLRRRKGLSERSFDGVGDSARAERECSYARLAAELRQHVRLDLIEKAMGL
ncbi:MAG: cobyric acid synthase [Planctomycetota bacterium]